MPSSKPTATLTDVKNKTGDVFALAEKNGSVMITSYNKPKYVICKYSVFEELQNRTIEDSPKVGEINVEITTPEPLVLPPAEIPAQVIAETIAEPVVEPQVEVAVEKEEPKPDKSNKPAPKSNAKNIEWWDRHNSLEQNWAKSLKSLL